MRRKQKFLGRLALRVVELKADKDVIDLKELLNILGKRQVTSVLVEGGSGFFGSLFDSGLVDKVMAFISPIIIGGDEAKSAVGGNGVSRVTEALRLRPGEDNGIW